LARTNYGYEKRMKDLKKKQKREAKLQKKQERREAKAQDTDDAEPDAEA
jgi:hypothetical protein